MSPATKAPAQKQRSRFREMLERFNPGKRLEQGMQEIPKGLETLAHEQRNKSREVAVQGRPETRALEEMLREERIKRLEKFVSHLKPEEQEEVSQFMERLLKWAEHHKQRGASPYWLEEHAEAHLNNFCSTMWKDSSYNKQRIKIMMRFLRANAILPEDHPASR